MSESGAWVRPMTGGRMDVHVLVPVSTPGLLQITPNFPVMMRNDAKRRVDICVQKDKI